MSQDSGDRAAFHVRSAEIAVALLFMALGAIVIVDSLRLGMRWGAQGPQPGFFPFYIGAIICVASALNLLRGIRLSGPQNRPFVGVAQLKLVLAVVVPTAIYVGVVGWLGLYVSAALFIAYFMRTLGGFAWWKIVAVSLGNSIVFYLLFETWFKVPLPKGPIEKLLGLD